MSGWVEDPWEKTLPPKLAEIENLDEEPSDPKEKFWEEAVERGSYVGPPQRLYTEVCRFGPDGEHTSMAKNCPHFEYEDEMGKNIRKGWTSQGG
jgi:hypothetical protein